MSTHNLRSRTQTTRRSLGRAQQSLSAPHTPSSSREVSPNSYRKQTNASPKIVVTPPSRRNSDESGSEYEEVTNVTIQGTSSSSETSPDTNMSKSSASPPGKESSEALSQIPIPKSQRQTTQKSKNSKPKEAETASSNAQNAQNASQNSPPPTSTESLVITNAEDQQQQQQTDFGIPGTSDISPLRVNRFDILNDFPEITLDKVPRKKKSNPPPRPIQRTHVVRTIPKKSGKIPPIVTYNLVSKQLAQGVFHTLGHRNFALKKRNVNCIEVLTKSLTDFEAVEKYLDRQKASFYSHTPQDLRPVSLIIRGIDFSVPIEDIQTDLLIQFPELNILSLTRYSTPASRRMNTELDLVLLQVPKSTNTKPLEAAKLLAQHVVTWEFLNQKDTLQCKKCQRFGHLARRCRLPFRCVKCKFEHKPGECSRTNPSEGLPWCVNCNKAGHPANFKDCPARLSYIERKENQEKERQNLLKEKRSMVDNTRREGISYADRLRPAPAPTPAQPQSTVQNIQTQVITPTQQALPICVPPQPLTGLQTANNPIPPPDLILIQEAFRNSYGMSLNHAYKKITELANFLRTSPDEEVKKQKLALFAFELGPLFPYLPLPLDP